MDMVLENSLKGVDKDERGESVSTAYTRIIKVNNVFIHVLSTQHVS